MSKIKIVTYNLRCPWSGEWDGMNSFIHRAGMIWEKINNEKPDVIGFQEAVPETFRMLPEIFPDYLFVGQGRLADYSGEGLMTAIRKDTMSLLGLETFWLSPTPFEPASRFENQSNCPRICVNTLIRHKETGERFRVYNVHLDHIGEEAKIKGIQCVMEFAERDKKNMNIPMVLLGDFNAEPGSETIEFCNNLKNVPLTDVTSHIKATFHDFGRREKDCKIDYIYVSDEWKKKAGAVNTWEDSQNGIYLSDHYPVCAEIEI